ncbi:hypothetical protein GCM10011514_44210 [Emticicia aquatilis]|uniref:Activator of Hsp90 ATPase homologue 1/2-like C-terminal domain-containing protein n=1 Tax=Emticicia aquatilis TaxID=1537369 RepID=A0A916Z3S9_9BACT|nr:SRPBCC domain-containing protein [Emticicia aquatilis]GGD75445.1 hypothetical protein GCM10011514_44210 [Emticicia aquatilis]
MKATNYSFEFTTEQDQAQIFSKLLDITAWWSGVYGETIIGESNKVGDEFTFEAGGGMHKSKQKLIELLPNQKIVWQVIDSNLSFLSNPSEWTNSKLIFELESQNNKTKVRFTHDGLTPSIECYEACSTGWSAYMKRFSEQMA